MGHKVHPKIHRTPFIFPWDSRWFARKEQMPAFLKQEVQIRKFLQTKLKDAEPWEYFETIQEGLDSLQARIRFVGPMMGMFAAQQTARNNGVPVNNFENAGRIFRIQVVAQKEKPRSAVPLLRWEKIEELQASQDSLQYCADSQIGSTNPDRDKVLNP